MSTATTTDQRDTPDLRRRAVRIVAALSVSVFIEWMGAGAILPLLPLYLRHHGSSDALVGATMAAFFAAAFLVQYPAGRLSDRVGRRPLQLVGLVVFATASIGFLLVAGPVAALFMRALQGVGAGMVDVASAALVGETSPPEWRGRSYGVFYGFRIGGLAIGPLVGSILGSGSMRTVFAGAAVCAVVAALPILLVVPAAAGRRPSVPLAASPGRPALWRRREVLGVVTVACAGGVVGGMYEVCWSLLLHLRGAASWQIGLSWTLFALPFVAMSLPAGWLVDHLDRRYLAGFSMLASAAFASTYPFLHSLDLLIGLGAAEATAVALAYPAMLSQLTAVISAGEMGRAQGFVSSAQTAATAVAAAIAGFLFSLGPTVPFLCVAATVFVLVLVLYACWKGVEGRGTGGGGSVPEPLAEPLREPLPVAL